MDAWSTASLSLTSALAWAQTIVSPFASFVTYHQGLVLEYISHFLILNRLLGLKCGLWTLLRYAFAFASKNDPGRSTREWVTDSLNSEAKPPFQDMVLGRLGVHCSRIFGVFGQGSSSSGVSLNSSLILAGKAGLQWFPQLTDDLKRISEKQQVFANA